MNFDRKFPMTIESRIIPNLVTCSGGSSETVESYLRGAENKKQNEIINNNNDGESLLHSYRGYSLIGGDDTVREVVPATEGKRPIWFIYTCTGTQWPNCARDMMKLEVFRNSINRCADVLRPKGIDLIQVLTDSDDETFENIQNIFISIAAVQVAFTDLLSYIGIRPDGIVGHSVGEFGSAYGDGCFTTEQIMLAAYWRGQSLLDTDLEPGLMVAVGLTWEEANKRVPDDVFAICHNGLENVTVSGKIEPVHQFAEQLKADGIFTHVCKTAGIAFHTKYLAEAAVKLKKSLESVIPNPKKRSPRWISSSVPPSEWNTPLAQYCSAACHVNNFLSPVHFIGALQHVPQNAICIEIAPTGLFQRDIQNSLSTGITYLSLMRRHHPDNLSFFLTSIGKLYNAGAEPNISKLYN